MSKQPSVTMPTSIEDASIELNEIGQLISAKGWHRAAIVATFVELPGSGGHQNRAKSKSALCSTRAKATSSLCSTRDFAALGIHGLRSKDTVQEYAERWLSRFPRPTPGSKVKLPTDEWPPSDNSGTRGYNSSEGAERTIARVVEQHGPAVIAKAVARNPAVARAIADDGDADLEVIRAHGARREEQRAAGQLKEPRKGTSTLLAALNKLLVQIGAMGYVRDGQRLFENLRERVVTDYQWRDGEREAVIDHIEQAMSYGRDSLALLTPLNDADLQRLLDMELPDS